MTDTPFVNRYWFSAQKCTVFLLEVPVLRCSGPGRVTMWVIHTQWSVWHGRPTGNDWPQRVGIRQCRCGKPAGGPLCWLTQATTVTCTVWHGRLMGSDWPQRVLIRQCRCG